MRTENHSETTTDTSSGNEPLAEHNDSGAVGLPETSIIGLLPVKALKTQKAEMPIQVREMRKPNHQV